MYRKMPEILGKRSGKHPSDNNSQIGSCTQNVFMRKHWKVLETTGVSKIHA